MSTRSSLVLFTSQDTEYHIYHEMIDDSHRLEISYGGISYDLNIALPRVVAIDLARTLNQLTDLLATDSEPSAGHDEAQS